MSRELYAVKDSEDYFRAGISSEDGTQALCGRQRDSAVLLKFSRDGRLVGSESKPLRDPSKDDASVDELGRWMEQLGFAPGTIRIRKFSIPERSMGIEDLPDYLQAYVESPSKFPRDRREHLSQRLDEWRRAGSYVLIWDEEYEMSTHGEVEST